MKLPLSWEEKFRGVWYILHKNVGAKVMEKGAEVEAVKGRAQGFGNKTWLTADFLSITPPQSLPLFSVGLPPSLSLSL